jgi:hypothetical protein
MAATPAFWREHRGRLKAWESDRAASGFDIADLGADPDVGKIRQNFCSTVARLKEATEAGEDPMTVRMTMKEWAHGWAICLFGLLMITASPALAETPAAILYDVTEVMKITTGPVPQRIAEGALAGPARLGTPLCPQRLASKLPPGATECWVIANGEDTIDLTTGQGTLSAIVFPVTTGDNPFAAPELALDRITVSGRIDFSPALAGLPYGTVEGNVDGGGRFTGVFLQPFVGSTIVNAKGQTLRQLLCPLSATRNQTRNQTGNHNDPDEDFAWLEISRGGPTGRCIDIQSAEMSLGYPTLRFDLFFE